MVGLAWIALAFALVVEPEPVLRRRGRRQDGDLPRNRRQTARRRVSHPYEITDVELTRLSESTPSTVLEGIEAADLEDARPTVENYAARQDIDGRADCDPPDPHTDGFVHRRRRRAELFLLILALVVGIGAYAAVGLGVEGDVPADILGTAAG